MKKTLIIIAIIVAVIAIPIVGAVGNYNGLVTMEEEVTSSWMQVENLLQRRYDLIPNLVEVTKGYASHEEEIFTQIADARSRIGQGGNREDMIEANEQLTGALSRLLVIAENYPELKASEHFIRLQDELAGTENRLAVARQDYNGVVEIFNGKIRSFPTNLFANTFGFDKQPYFQMNPQASEAPTVDFN
ncbi:MAG: LemA family protein [Clostridiaceae bacterium]|nr:LemA family protein [Clostridiaceae bacterium]